jgi:hypothetical protein
MNSGSGNFRGKKSKKEALKKEFQSSRKKKVDWSCKSGFTDHRVFKIIRSRQEQVCA